MILQRGRFSQAVVQTMPKESYLGRLEYGFKGKFLVNASARYDQSSNFAEDKGEVFGGLGLAWRLKEEDFMQSAEFINDLKLRVAWGVTGNDAIDGGKELFIIWWRPWTNIL